jgi:hypothetical protein
MSKYNLNGNNVENGLVIDNTNGISINGSSLFNFPNKYKAKIGSSKYSYTTINYKINDVDQGTLLSPKIKVFNTAGSTTHILQNNTRNILCICQGGGAGGTGGNYDTGGNYESGGAGSGGGGGGLAWVLYKVNGGETLTIVVGGGGSGGSEGDPYGTIGTKGGNTSASINSINICQGEGGAPGVAESGDRNYGSISGPTVSGTYVSNLNTLDGGTKSGLSGSDGQIDPENGQSSTKGLGGAGGNGGTTTYTYGMGTRTSSASSPTLTINPLQFDSVDFIDANITMDPNTTFTYTDFIGTNTSTFYGRGGNGGNGEGRNNGTSENGSAGYKGFVVIAEYGA